MQRKRQKEAEREREGGPEASRRNRQGIGSHVAQGYRRDRSRVEDRQTSAGQMSPAPSSAHGGGEHMPVRDGRQRRTPVFTGSTGLFCLSPGKMWATLGRLLAPASGVSPARWGPFHGLRMEKACPILLRLGLCQGLHQFQRAASPPTPAPARTSLKDGGQKSPLKGCVCNE